MHSPSRRKQSTCRRRTVGDSTCHVQGLFVRLTGLSQVKAIDVKCMVAMMEGRRKHKHHGLVGAGQRIQVPLRSMSEFEGTASPKVKDFAYRPEQRHTFPCIGMFIRMESQAPSSLA